MRCSNVQRKLEAYLTEELHRSDRKRVERHLAACSDCSRALRQARQMHIWLRDDAPPVPANLRARLMARAGKQVETRPHAERLFAFLHWKPLFPPPRILAGAATGVVVALLAGALIGYDMGQSRGRGQETRGRAPQPDAVFIYGAEAFGDAPAGSMAGAYANLVAARQGE